MAIPAQLGRYRILQQIGQGAMGSVYKALDPAIDRMVAIKTVGAGLLAHPDHAQEFLERFHREARAAGRLSHPHIVPVYDLGVDSVAGTPFIVMEYVPGVTLATVLHENRNMPVDQALDIVEGVGSALQEAHAHGIIHRDVKPGNIFLDSRGRVKVGDFGIARIEDSDLTQAGTGLGTPGYMAPEVLRGGKADARSDLFSLGVVAYALLTGRRPFNGATRESVNLEVFQVEPVPPHRVRAEIPEEVSGAVMRCLAKSPSDRPESVSRFLDEIGRPGRGLAPSAPRPSSAASRRALLAAVVAAALLTLAALLAFRAWASWPQPAAAAPAGAPSPQRVPSPRLTPSASPRSVPGDGRNRDEEEDQGPRGRGRGHKKGR